MRSLIFFLFLSFNATAALYDRGNGLIYDDVLDITWLADANYAQTSGYDADGRMDWQASFNWVDGLSLGGFSDWRLPLDAEEGVDYSELQYMFITNLGNPSSLCQPSCTENVSFTDALSGMSFSFLGLENQTFWYGGRRLSAWKLNYRSSWMNSALAQMSNTYSAWAVHDGDIGLAPVPLPAGIYLFLSGLVGLGFVKGKKK